MGSNIYHTDYVTSEKWRIKEKEAEPMASTMYSAVLKISFFRQ